MPRIASPLAGVLALAVLLAPATPASAQHVVWVDFTTRSFDLSAFNNSSIDDARSENAVKARILHLMAEDYANYDVQLTTFRPPAGRYTRLVIGGDVPGNPAATTLGTSLPWGQCTRSQCGEALQATDHGSWKTDKESLAFVFSDNFAVSGMTGSSANVDSIATAVARTASHELGHVLGLEHWFAIDTYEAGFGLPQNSSQVDTSLDWSSRTTGGIMGDPTNIRFAASAPARFSPHISNEHLMRNMGTRNYHQSLGRFDGGRNAATGDLLIGQMRSPSAVAWGVSYSRNGAFTSASAYATDAGDPTDVFLAGDVDGDGDTDLVYGRPSAAKTVRWFVRKAGGGRFGDYETWVSDAGDVGDVFRIGDVNGDGRDDLLYGRPATGNHHPNATPLTWYVRLSTGSAFGGYSQWLASGGYQGHPVFVRDFDGDGRADLVTSRVPTGQPGIWTLHRSTGQAFARGSRLFAGTGVETDRFFLDDVTGDGKPDFIIGRRLSRNNIRWYVRNNVNGRAFHSDAKVWINDSGNSGDIFRVGDATGDGRADLVIVRRDNLTGSVLWVSPSTGSTFGAPARWARNVGRDGFLLF